MGKKQRIHISPDHICKYFRKISGFRMIQDEKLPISHSQVLQIFNRLKLKEIMTISGFDNILTSHEKLNEKTEHKRAHNNKRCNRAGKESN